MPYNYLFWILTTYLFVTGFRLHGQTGDRTDQVRWVVIQSSSLSVNGSTNINKFACVIPAYGRTDTLTVSKSKKNEGVTFSGSIGLNISSFDCHISAMTKQLQKTLKEKQFPVLHIRFISLSKLPDLTTGPEAIKGLVEIEIAGVSKRFEISYRINLDEQKTIHLLGSRVINFSDFNLIPPKKLGGMIKTKDELSVEFYLNIKAI